VTDFQEGKHMRLNGKIAVITGAGSGIGRAMATRFGSEGASVAAVVWNVEQQPKLRA
jgi:NAD(P)-dependent dehydrogenase (short-subunit alcohol dehydrogenase family)